MFRKTIPKSSSACAQNVYIPDDEYCIGVGEGGSSAPVGVEALYIVVLSSSEAAGCRLSSWRGCGGGCGVWGSLLAGVCKAMTKSTQVLPITCLNRHENMESDIKHQWLQRTNMRLGFLGVTPRHFASGHFSGQRPRTHFPSPLLSSPKYTLVFFIRVYVI